MHENIHREKGLLCVLRGELPVGKEKAKPGRQLLYPLRLHGEKRHGRLVQVTIRPRCQNPKQSVFIVWNNIKSRTWGVNRAP